MEVVPVSNSLLGYARCRTSESEPRTAISHLDAPEQLDGCRRHFALRVTAYIILGWWLGSAGFSVHCPSRLTLTRSDGHSKLRWVLIQLLGGICLVGIFTWALYAFWVRPKVIRAGGHPLQFSPKTHSELTHRAPADFQAGRAREPSDLRNLSRNGAFALLRLRGPGAAEIPTDHPANAPPAAAVGSVLAHRVMGPAPDPDRQHPVRLSFCGISRSHP